MAELIKAWENGGNLSVTYEGSGDGEAVFSSDTNEGIDREMSVTFKGGGVSVERKVTQRGLRQRFATAGGKIFCVANGGRFGVLKVGEPIVPPTPMETYTRLTYIECNGQQYIDLGYVVKEDDVIESNFILTKVASVDHFLFGTADTKNGLWYEIYSSTAYVRFGNTSSTSASSSAYKYSIELRKGSVQIGTDTTSLGYNAMPTTPINLFAGRSSAGDAYSYGYYRCTKFRISDSNGVVMDLVPAKRDSDGVVGMLDLVSGTFYTSAEEPFIAGEEMRVTEGYELLEYTTFDGTQLFDLGIVKSTYELEVLFQRSESKATPYLYGCVTSPHTASVTAYLSSGGSWRWGNAYKGISTNNLNEWRVRMKNGNALYNGTSSNFTKNTFTTPDTVVLGGYRAASGSLVKGYQGKVFYIRISEDGAYLKDWYPCQRLSDGVEGFWDCVTQTFIEPIS
ncbi:MAG: hypothetical protein J6U73_07880 [Alistipes sp.]|nr:hypothetical protein [Alistipes sp.]